MLQIFSAVVYEVDETAVLGIFSGGGGTGWKVVN